MYNVQLDEQNYFTGSYAKVGKVRGGIDVPILPPDMNKATCYKWETREVVVEVGINDSGEPITEPTKITKWWFDHEKCRTLDSAQRMSDIRSEREEVFKLIDKYQLPLLYSELTQEQQEELKAYRRAWLDAPETLSIPDKPEWIVD